MLYKKFVQKVQWILFQTQPLNKSIPFQTQHMNRRYIRYLYKTNISKVGMVRGRKTCYFSVLIVLGHKCPKCNIYNKNNVPNGKYTHNVKILNIKTSKYCIPKIILSSPIQNKPLAKNILKLFST